MQDAARGWYWFGWGLLICVVNVCFWINPARNCDALRTAAQGWLDGEPLYGLEASGLIYVPSGVAVLQVAGQNHWLDAATSPPKVRGFLYAPQAALALTPFALFPRLVGESLWRIVNILIFAWGTRRLAQCVLKTERHVQLAALFAIPISFGSAHIGQPNIIMAGCMMLATASVAEQRWWSAAWWTWGVVAIKPPSMVLAFLLTPLFPPLLLRSLVVLPALAVLPYLAQSPAYVTSQYFEFLDMLKLSSSVGDLTPYAHIFCTLGFLGVDVPSVIRTAIRMGAALLTFAVCCRVRLRTSPAEWGILFYGMAASYLIAFSPRTEGVTFAILGPIMGVLFVRTLVEGNASMRRLRLAALGTMGSLALVNYELGKLVLPQSPAHFFSPIVGICFFAWMCVLSLTTTDDAGGTRDADLGEDMANTPVRGEAA